MRLTLGTRGSQLALTQTRQIERALLDRGYDVEIEIIKTSGDADQVRPFAEVGEPGLFVREIERALLDGRIDVAVHSYKDLPSESPAGLVVAAVPERVDPRDRLLVAPGAHDPEGVALPLRRGARIGTASARRRALLRDLRPDLELALLRGNVPTRVGKVTDGELDATLLARAGLLRLDRAAARGEGDTPSRRGLVEVDLDAELFVPAPSQGALALQIRSDDAAVADAIVPLDDLPAHRAVTAERALLALVDAGCQIPFGAHCRAAEGERLELIAALETAGELRRARAVGDDPRALAEAVFAQLRGEGGGAR